LAWVYLIVAGIFEWGWPIGLKLGWTDQGAHYGWITLPIVCMVVMRYLARACFKGGEVPFYDLCRLGIRGFSATQYMADTLLSGRAELPWHVVGPTGVTGFVGTGAVAPRGGELAGDDFVVGYGAGRRLTVLKSQQSKLRVDYARGNGEDTFCLSVNEAL
jgi:hypothetical protein